MEGPSYVKGVCARECCASIRSKGTREDLCVLGLEVGEREAAVLDSALGSGVRVGVGVGHRAREGRTKGVKRVRRRCV